MSLYNVELKHLDTLNAEGVMARKELGRSSSWSNELKQTLQVKRSKCWSSTTTSAIVGGRSANLVENWLTNIYIVVVYLQTVRTKTLRFLRIIKGND